MTRNEESRFAELPQVNIERSIFRMPKNIKTSGNVGELIPFYVQEVLPGDTFRVSTSKVIRFQTMLTPVMDNAYADFYYFYVPNRIVHKHWQEVFLENNATAWTPTVSYTVPTISAPSGGFAVGTIADYMGLPVGVDWTANSFHAPMVYPFRGYARICNDFFRDENLTDPLNIPDGDSNQTGTNGSNYINDVANGGKPFKVAKYHDYFTSVLPSPLKAGSSVPIPLSGLAPVRPYEKVDGTTSVHTPFVAIGHNYAFGNDTLTHLGRLGWSDYSNTSTLISASRPLFAGIDSVVQSTFVGDIFTENKAYNVAPLNLWADLGYNYGSVGMSINDLRLAFQLQKFYEASARYGSRYTETLRGHYGVISPDARLQRPEYLGGNRVPIQVHQVANTGQTATDFLGDVGALSVTSDVNEDFEKSFTEHGFVIGVFCVRYDHSYSQGIERFWMRHKFSDFYIPVFANIGEQPVYDAEIYATSANIYGNASNDTTYIFGYQEAWADYRYSKNMTTGEMRPGVANTLSSWHYGDYYTQAPVLSDAWIREDLSNVDRTLAVQSSAANQFWADIEVMNIATRPLPMYSIPGLIDHH